MENTLSNSTEQVNSKMNNMMAAMSDAMGQIVEVFEKTIDVIADYGVGVAQRVKKV